MITQNDKFSSDHYLWLGCFHFILANYLCSNKFTEAINIIKFTENTTGLITSISISNGVLTLNYTAKRDWAGNYLGDRDTHTSKFYIRSSNGINGAPVDSNLITFNNKKA